MSVSRFQRKFQSDKHGVTEPWIMAWHFFDIHATCAHFADPSLPAQALSKFSACFLTLCDRRFLLARVLKFANFWRFKASFAYGCSACALRLGRAVRFCQRSNLALSHEVIGSTLYTSWLAMLQIRMVGYSITDCWSFKSTLLQENSHKNFDLIFHYLVTPGFRKESFWG